MKQAANDLLFLAPRNSFGAQEDDSIFDLKIGMNEITISLHDRGELLEVAPDAHDDGVVTNADVARILSNANDFQQKLNEGYRQITISFRDDQPDRNTAGAMGG